MRPERNYPLTAMNQAPLPDLAADFVVPLAAQKTPISGRWRRIDMRSDEAANIQADSGGTA
jgi:hypothetical protein